MKQFTISSIVERPKKWFLELVVSIIGSHTIVKECFILPLVEPDIHIGPYFLYPFYYPITLLVLVQYREYYLHHFILY